MKAKRTQNESALACAARRGDKEAVRLLLQRNWTWLKGLVYSVVADTHDLDDVLQDVCLRVITRVHTLREPERFRAWLAILARHEALKHCRRRVHQRMSLEDPAATCRPQMTLEAPPEVAEKKELCEHILDVVKTLPEKYREVFILAHCSELTYAEMAEVLDVPMTTMQIRLVRARQMVRDQVMNKTRYKVQER